MPGMNSGLSPADPTLVAAFRSALLHQGAVGALAVILIGAAPMASAAANRTADPILALAIAGNSTALDVAAAGFQLTDQNGQAVSLASLRGKVVLMSGGWPRRPGPRCR